MRGMPYRHWVIYVIVTVCSTTEFSCSAYCKRFHSTLLLGPLYMEVEDPR